MPGRPDLKPRSGPTEGATISPASTTVITEERGSFQGGYGDRNDSNQDPLDSYTVLDHDSEMRDHSKLASSASVPSKWWSALKFGVILLDFIIVAGTVGLLAFVCVVASLQGRAMDSQYPSFQSALTTVFWATTILIT